VQAHGTGAEWPFQSINYKKKMLTYYLNFLSTSIGADSHWGCGFLVAAADFSLRMRFKSADQR
jgi:hypothetical protein